tara:strand:- start:623 stop:1258 length:636 start_codon:yes stop_codon:yes gene_type:complete
MPVSKILTKEDILRAQSQTRSNMHAARVLHVSYEHYKKYAKMYKNDDGVSLLEAHKNQAGKGIKKYSAKNLPDYKAVLNGETAPRHFDDNFRNDIKNRIVFEALKEEKCERCGFNERRVTDTQVPITISHKDGNTKNFHLDNIEFLCLNCSFLFGTVAEKSKVKVDITQKVDRTKENEDWEMDESHREHLKNLGLLDDENENPGEEYISRL